MATTHQAKRPYAGSQPCITNYFPQSTSSQPACNINTSSSGISRSFPSSDDSRPSLPANVQSNLLTVGMRVRKSVPEGYKTGSSYSAYALFADDSTHSSSVSSAETQQKGPRRVGGTRPRARELTPFCGILKVGGMGTQQWGIYDASPDGDGPSWRDEELGVDEVPFLSSQGSTVSNSSVGSVSGVNRNKRRFDVEDEEERDGVVVLGLGQRVMAVPRRRKVQSQGKMAGIDVVQQENLDFEDADFLDYGLVGEVEMGGV